MQFSMSRELYDYLGEVSDLSLRDDYSGRGMFGATCFGIDTSSLATVAKEFDRALCDVMSMCASDEPEVNAIAEEAEELRDMDIFQSYCQDNMGLDYIVYFPGVTVESE